MERPHDNDTMPLVDGFNFTPIYQGERVRMRISERENEQITRGPGFKGHVTDIDTGKVYRVFGHPCPLPECYCDARIEDAQ